MNVMSKAALTLPAAAILFASIVATGCGPQCTAGPPLADDDRAITTRGTPVGLSILANDVACGATSLDLHSLDLDPTTPGTQLSITTDAGGYMLDCLGDVRFVPAHCFSGEATTPYTIADSDGQVSQPARILVTVKAD
jgi:hypothetical protein